MVLGDGFSRDGLIAYLFQQGIDSRPFFKPMHQLPIHHRDIVLPVSERLSSQGISLPSYPELSETDILYITSHIHKYLQS